jgi:hypothetical protein
MPFCRRLLRGWLVPCESVIQKVTNELKGLVGSSEPSHPLKKAVKHAFPDIEASIDSCSDSALDEADGIVQQYLVVADMHQNRR